MKEGCTNNVVYICVLHFYQGMTGFPWIDAVMRQLREEGWIPHVARQAVGCFLTRGCLWINWEEGYKVQYCDNKMGVQKSCSHFTKTVFWKTSSGRCRFLCQRLRC